MQTCRLSFYRTKKALNVNANKQMAKETKCMFFFHFLCAYFMLLACKAGSAAVEFVNRICVLVLRLSPCDICLFARMGRKDTRITDMIMWLS